MKVEAHCQGVVVVGNIVKVLLTWQRSPDDPEENALLNVLKKDEAFARDKIYRITIEEVT